MARRRKKKWIAGAIKRPGALRRKVKAKKMSITEYCKQSKLLTRSKRQCALSKTLKKLRGKRRGG